MSAQAAIATPASGDLGAVMHGAGDNRDCTYLSTLPFNTLDSPDLVLLVAGINHVKAGVRHAWARSSGHAPGTRVRLCVTRSAWISHNVTCGRHRSRSSRCILMLSLQALTLSGGTSLLNRRRR
jgi:hypothetical protein